MRQPLLCNGLESGVYCMKLRAALHKNVSPEAFFIFDGRKHKEYFLSNSVNKWICNFKNLLTVQKYYGYEIQR